MLWVCRPERRHDSVRGEAQAELAAQVSERMARSLVGDLRWLSHSHNTTNDVFTCFIAIEYTATGRLANDDEKYTVSATRACGPPGQTRTPRATTATRRDGTLLHSTGIKQNPSAWTTRAAATLRARTSLAKALEEAFIPKLILTAAHPHVEVTVWGIQPTQLLVQHVHAGRSGRCRCCLRLPALLAGLCTRLGGQTRLQRRGYE